MTLLTFPRPADAQVAAALREMCDTHALSPEQRTRVLSRYLRTLATGRSNAVAVMDARGVMHAYDRRHVHTPGGAA